MGYLGRRLCGCRQLVNEKTNLNKSWMGIKNELWTCRQPSTASPRIAPIPIMSVAPMGTVKGRSINSSAAKLESEPKPEAERIAIGIRIRIWDWDNARGGPLSKLALQISSRGRLPIELALELADGPLLSLELSFELRNLLLLRFYESVHATGLRVACVV
jgi:hypothetical protein